MREVVKNFVLHGMLNQEMQNKSKKHFLLPVKARFKTQHIMLGLALEVLLSMRLFMFSHAFADLQGSSDTV